MGPIFSSREFKGYEAILVSLALVLSFSLPFARGPKNQAEVPAAVKTQAPAADPDRMPDSLVPEFLRGLVPDTVSWFCMQDVDGPNGDRKLIGWSKMMPNEWITHIELISFRPGERAKRIWQSPIEGDLYDPQIKPFPGCNYHGHQIFLVLEQRGAAWQSARPVCIDHDCVRMLPALESEYFEVAELPGRQSHHLVGYARFPVSVEMPTIYEWTGTDFVQDNHRYPQFYKKLADERRADLTEPDCVCGEHYCEAVLLNRAGCNSDALAVLKNERWDYVAKSEEPHLIYGCAELMDRLGSRRDALVLALTLRREIYRCKNAARQYNPEEGYYLNYVDPEISYKGALLLEKLGRKKEALTLLKKVREDVADSKIPNLFKEYKRLLSRLEKES